MESEREGNFVQQVCELPLVSSVLQHVSTAYVEKKNTSILAWLTCETCEIGFKVASVAVRPVIGLLQEPIEKLNGAACNGLNHLTSVCPSINISSTELLESVQEHFGAFLMLSHSDQDMTLAPSSGVDYEDSSGSGSQSLNPVPSANRRIVISYIHPGLVTCVDMVLGLGVQLSSFIKTITLDHSAWNPLHTVTRVSNTLARRCSTLHSCLCSQCHTLPSQFCVVIEGEGQVGEGLCVVCFVLKALHAQKVSFDRTTRLVLHKIKAILSQMMSGCSWCLDHSLSLSVTLLDLISSLPPLIWLVPDVDVRGDRPAPEVRPHDDDDVSVRYVPVHPVDLANFIILPTPRRVYWRRTRS